MTNYENTTLYTGVTNDLIKSFNSSWNDLIKNWIDCHVEALASPRNDRGLWVCGRIE